MGTAGRAAEMEENSLAIGPTYSEPYQPCPPTSTVKHPQSSDQRCLSRIPHAQDRARLESSRRLRHAGNFISDWRHGNDRLRLDSSQRHCPDRTRLYSSRRPPHPKRRRGRDVRRQADARHIIKDRHITLPSNCNQVQTADANKVSGRPFQQGSTSRSNFGSPNVYSQLMLPGLQLAAMGQLTAQNTTLGYIVSGVV
ncbi:uncharacterized protein LOC120780671 [Bactrocera tryoni]|uniref:uncharacterized protein LOC120780671 n=1 Tax=Bactrocera tryoni TaxID=59916 RepID=UPI001A9593F5|nr:uncharacterized protein LOC120780671 [Bactrocera tryoni]